mgnify:CR=1 FL=1
MKHIIILGDGMADWPVKALGGKTLLQAAATPLYGQAGTHGTCGKAGDGGRGISSRQ